MEKKKEKKVEIPNFATQIKNGLKDLKKGKVIKC